MMLKERPSQESANCPENLSGLPEPFAFFVSTSANGHSGKTVERITYFQLKSSFQETLAKSQDLEKQLRGIKEREQEIRRKKMAGSGKPYSQTEIRQIYQKIASDRNRTLQEIGKNQQLAHTFRRMTSWVVLSDPNQPLIVEIDLKNGDKVISGKSLSEEEAAWRSFVLREVPALWGNELAKEFFKLRRKSVLGNPGEVAEAQRRLPEFRRNASGSISPQLAPDFRKIAECDFKEPL